MTLVLGGAKINGKIELIENFLSIADNLLIGGALSLPFLKSKGINIESTLVNNESVSKAERILEIAKSKGKKIILPTDFVTAKSLDNIDSINVKLLGDIKSDENCYDIGPETTMIFSKILSRSETILWNGPLGVSENPYFGTGTQQICRIIEELTKNGIISILGGGDTASAATRFSVSNRFTHISTGGGASLELLSGKKLPALKALGYYDK
jgi:3-phosphoglycerate kinase